MVKFNCILKHKKKTSEIEFLNKLFISDSIFQRCSLRNDFFRKIAISCNSPK